MPLITHINHYTCDPNHCQQLYVMSKSILIPFLHVLAFREAAKNVLFLVARPLFLRLPLRRNKNERQKR